VGGVEAIESCSTGMSPDRLNRRAGGFFARCYSGITIARATANSMLHFGDILVIRPIIPYFSVSFGRRAGRDGLETYP
jgi:hypothetical protein